MTRDSQKHLPVLRRTVGYAVVLLAFFFLARVLYQNQAELSAQTFSFQLDLVSLGLALSFQVIGLSLSVETWRRLLAEMDGHIAFKDAFRIWFYSNLMRYIPGNIWQPATMAVLGEQLRIPKSKTILSQALFILLTLALAGVLSISLVPVAPDLHAALTILCAVATLFFALPPVFRLVLRVIARVMRYESARVTPTFWRGLLPLIVASAMWVAYGLSFYFFVRGLGIAGEPTWLTSIALYAGAYLIGYVSLITPSGLGVREGVMAFLLSAYLPASTAVVVALLARLLSIAGEMVCVGTAWLVTRIHN